MHLKCFKIDNYSITFTLHCLPKSEYLTVICFYPYYVMFTFPAMIFYREVPGFATDCPCSVWCRLTTCLLYVVPSFGNLIKMIIDL